MKNIQKRQVASARPRRRSGAVLVEAAITLPVFLLIVFGTIDLGIAVQRWHLCAEAARIGARMAIVHGSDASELGPWTSASAVADIRTRINPLMAAAAIAPQDVQVTVIYQKTADEKDDNAPGREVLVRVTVNYAHLVSFLRLAPITLGSESRMIISN